MARYQWKETGPQPRVAADVFGAVVEKIGGDPRIPHAARPQAIVDAARPRSSPIHRLFPWRDEVAAEAHRRHLARKYMGQLEMVHVQMKGSRATSSQAFYSVQVGRERGYMPRNYVLSDRDLKVQVIEAAKKELESYLRKYEGVLRLGNIIPRLHQIIDDMEKEINRLAQRAVA